MTSERPIVNSAEPSKVSAISNSNIGNIGQQQFVQPQLSENKISTPGPFGGGFKIPEYVKIIIYFAIIFIPICCLMLWLINKGRKVSMMLDKTAEENENLQRQIENLKAQNLRLERGNNVGNGGNSGSCCFKPKQPLRPSNLKPHNPQQTYQTHPQQHNDHNGHNDTDPFVEQPTIDPTIGNINLIIDPDGNLYTSTGIIFTAPGMEMNNGVKHPDVRIEEIPDDENGTPIEDFDDVDQANNQTPPQSQQAQQAQQDREAQEAQESEPLLDQENEETQPKQPTKSTPKGAPSKK